MYVRKEIRKNLYRNEGREKKRERIFVCVIINESFMYPRESRLGTQTHTHKAAMSQKEFYVTLTLNYVICLFFSSHATRHTCMAYPKRLFTSPRIQIFC